MATARLGLKAGASSRGEPPAATLAEIEPAIERGVLGAVGEPPGRSRFSHALVREAIYRDLGDGARLEAHRRLAESILALYAGQTDEHLGEIAHDLLKASASGEVRAAVDALIAAAKRATDVHAHEDAASQYERALALLDRGAAPDQEFHVLDIASAGGEVLSGQAPETDTVSDDLGDSGPVLDERAKQEYRRRRADLRQELEEAESFRDHGRAERARAELEALDTELTRAIGRAGRDRRGDAASERARASVSKAIRAALKAIEEHEPEFAQVLRRAVRTGTFCAYEPPADFDLRAES